MKSTFTSFRTTTCLTLSNGIDLFEFFCNFNTKQLHRSLQFVFISARKRRRKFSRFSINTIVYRQALYRTALSAHQVTIFHNFRILDLKRKLNFNDFCALVAQENSYNDDKSYFPLGAVRIRNGLVQLLAYTPLMTCFKTQFRNDDSG